MRTTFLCRPAPAALAPELFMSAFVVSTCMPYYFWWFKPQHAEASVVLYCEHSMAKILEDTGLAPGDYVDTPRDFVEKPLQQWERRQLFRADIPGEAEEWT
ncbi:hypothetical protein DL764_003929 [Monosporascus ibericus]|uniref:Uncharacterized protein n=1 Tax=Monosporascus ibericus TaxID=155417 RepID=A0A4Q4TFB0_9PEZI|nr:hypothetical protein DL764_003929 [Monosporascus ibericus]